MHPSESEKIRRDDLRVEYAAAASYHTSLITLRFTTAGFLMTCYGFLAAVAFSPDRPYWVKFLTTGFATWVTACVWLLEIRCRTLYRKTADRCIKIERKHWGMDGPDSFEGWFSAEYKTDPGSRNPDELIQPTRPSRDIPELFGRKLSPWWGWVSFSHAFDLMYLGGCVIWSVTSFWYLERLLLLKGWVTFGPVSEFLRRNFFP